MLKIISEEKLKNQAIYQRNNFIPISSPFSYEPFEYCETFGYNPETLSHLRKIYDFTKFLKQLLDTLYIIYNTDIEQDIADFENYNLLTPNEIKGFQTIQHGKKIFSKLKEIEYSPFVTPELLSIIKRIKKSKEQLSDSYKQLFIYDNYPSLNPEEIDIYTFLSADVELIILPIIEESITPHEYFTNNGKCYLSIDTKQYLYLIGNNKGKIKEYPNYKYFKETNSKEIWEDIKIDFDNFITDLKQILFNFRSLNLKQEEINKPVFVESIKEAMFLELSKREEYRNIKKIFNEIDDYFIPLFNLGYITYLNDTLQLMHPLRQNAFYEMLRDKDFYFSKHFSLIKAPLSKLLKKEIDNFRQDVQPSARYPNIKADLEKCNVPSTNKYQTKNL